MHSETTEKGDLTVAAAAAALGTTPTAILMLLRRGELAGRETDGTWLVARQSLERLHAGRKTEAPLIACQSSCAGCTSCGPDVPKK